MPCLVLSLSSRFRPAVSKLRILLAGYYLDDDSDIENIRLKSRMLVQERRKSL